MGAAENGPREDDPLNSNCALLARVDVFFLSRLEEERVMFLVRNARA